MRYTWVREDYDTLQRQVEALRVALKAAREAADVERRRADAEASARRAWQVSVTFPPLTRL